jgi:hypothetical protein
MSPLAHLLLGPKQLCIYVLFNKNKKIKSYIIIPENVLRYHIQPEITSGYQSGDNSPALRPEIRLSWILCSFSTNAI